MTAALDMRFRKPMVMATGSSDGIDVPAPAKITRQCATKAKHILALLDAVHHRYDASLAMGMVMPRPQAIGRDIAFGRTV